MRILITGSSGQIGTNLGLLLQQQEHEVFGVDKRANTWTEQIEMIQQDLSLTYRNFKGGIGEVEYPTQLDVVVHLAAYAKVHELVEYPDRAMENINMIFNVLEFCRQNQLPLIFGSSREVYGNLTHEEEVTAETLANFNLAASPYAASKIAGESLIYSYARCYDIPYLVFRFSNVYGRYDNDIDRMERVIPLFIHKMSHHQPITIFGRDKLLDFTYIDDCVAGIAKGINRLCAGEVVNRTINLAYGEGNSLIKMAKYISEALNVKPNITIEESQVGEVKHYIADISQARQYLDYNPTVSLEEGIRRAVAWSTEQGNKVTR